MSPLTFQKGDKLMSIKTIMLTSALTIAFPWTLATASEIRIGFANEPLTLDPANHRNRDTETIIRNMYDGLVTRDGNMKVVPELVKSYTQVSPTVYDFVIRRGVKFHDGSEMTLDDVKFTLDRLTVDGAMDGQTSPRKSLMGPVSKIEKLDEDTIRIHLSEPWPILPAMLPNQQIVSEAFVKANGENALATKVNGTGPFKLVDWRKGETIIMERFDDYYGGSPDVPPVGKACVERAIFKVIPENASRVAALLAGDVDIITELPAFSVSQIKNNPNTDVMSVNGTRSFFIALNNEGSIFNNLKVRQAMAHAVDKNLIVDKLFNGTAALIDGILSPDAFAYNPDLITYDYDPAKAKALLAEAGYPDGIDVTLETEGAYKDTAEAIGALMGKSGIRVSIVTGENSQLVSKWRTQGTPKTGDMWLTSWGNGSLDPYDIFVPTHRSNDRGNSSGYANPELDKLLDDAGIETDVAKRAALYQQAETIVNRDLPYIYLWVPQDIYGVSKRLSGWKPSADSRIHLHDACVN